MPTEAIPEGWMTFNQAAKSLGTTNSRVASNCSRLGIEFKRTPTYRLLPTSTVRDLLRKGLLCNWSGCTSRVRRVNDRWELKCVPHQSGFSIGDTRPAVEGYVQVWSGEQWMSEHRWVMELHLGRALVRGENVHHLNGVRDDNRIENLELWFSPQPYGQRVSDLIPYVVEHHKEALLNALAERKSA